jgi:hypothetical protein
MSFRGPKAHPNRPQKAMACPTEQHSRNQTLPLSYAPWRGLPRPNQPPDGLRRGLLSHALRAELRLQAPSGESLRAEKILRCCSTLLPHVPLIMRGCIARGITSPKKVSDLTRRLHFLARLSKLAAVPKAFDPGCPF